MLENKSRFNEALSQQFSDYLAYEAEIKHYTIDCYPYAIRGMVFGLLLSAIFWGSVIGILMLIF